MLNKLTKLLFWHSLTDLALQTAFIAKWKDPLLDSPDRTNHWFEVLLAHALINGWGVLVCTSYVRLAILETIWHFLTDFCSSMDAFSHTTDQFYHFTCKVLIAIIWYALEKDKLLKEETKRYWARDKERI